MPVLGRYWADAGSIGPEPAQFWHITIGLQGPYLSITFTCDSITFNYIVMAAYHPEITIAIIKETSLPYDGTKNLRLKIIFKQKHLNSLPWIKKQNNADLNNCEYKVFSS